VQGRLYHDDSVMWKLKDLALVISEHIPD